MRLCGHRELLGNASRNSPPFHTESGRLHGQARPGPALSRFVPCASAELSDRHARSRDGTKARGREGKTYRLRQELRRSDETLAAEVTSVSGLLDLNSRSLLPDEAGGWRSVATTPEQLGL